jgi:hypothetical protein
VSLATVQFSRSAKRQTLHTAARDLVQRATGGAPVSQNSTACGPPRSDTRSERAACQARSTSLVAERARGERREPDELEELEEPKGGVPAGARCPEGLPRKEVIQPQLPLRLPCYDFTPVASPTFDGSLQKVRPPASGVTHSHGVTGGVYKARERIHRGSADPRLLATPPSCRRVSACNPNRDAL